MTPFDIFSRLALVAAVIALFSACTSAGPTHDTDVPLGARVFVVQCIQKSGPSGSCYPDAAEQRERVRRDRDEEAEEQRQRDHIYGRECEIEDRGYRKVIVCL